MSEEEDRRRCILDPTTCKAPMTQVTALADFLGEEGDGPGDRSGHIRKAQALIDGGYIKSPGPTPQGTGYRGEVPPPTPPKSPMDAA